jgi:hypothetical protein
MAPTPFGSQLTCGSEDVSLRRPPSAPRKIPGTQFCKTYFFLTTYKVGRKGQGNEKGTEVESGFVLLPGLCSLSGTALFKLWEGGGLNAYG